MTAEQLAREIADSIWNHIFDGEEEIVKRIISAKLAPLVADAERLRSLSQTGCIWCGKPIARKRGDQ